MCKQTILNAQEKLVIALREQFEAFGYKRFPMRRFEEYTLYATHQSFLQSTKVLTFTNAKGNLMALKPDVTLSIAKHSKVQFNESERVYYLESVYRTSHTEQEFVEIQQLGVEYLGHVDTYAILEIMGLAIETLKKTEFPHVLSLSHMGYVQGLLQEVKLEETIQKKILELISMRNQHELKSVLKNLSISSIIKEAFMALPTLQGNLDMVLPKARQYCQNKQMSQALQDLQKIYECLDNLQLADCIQIDFSMMNDMDYYQGIIFRGYIQNAPRMVLSGGGYDPLLEKLGKNIGGIGFAVYLNELETVLSETPIYDVDAVLYYSPSANPITVFQALQKLQKQHKTVIARDYEGELRARKKYYLVGECIKEEGIC